jgi:hypothetical protein
VKGGVILFRGSGSSARRYLESNRSRADEYYLDSTTALAEFTVVDGNGAALGAGALTPDQYAAWVDWVNPFTAESMGAPRESGDGRSGSPRFAEMVINAPKSLSIAAALHPEVSDALDLAQEDAAAEIRRWLGQHSITRVGPRGLQEAVPVEQLETVAVRHKTSRAGDPHRHIHFQIGTRVWAAGAWRALDTSALFKQQGAIRALGTAVIAAHPKLAVVLAQHGLTINSATGEVVELEPFNAQMSKRSDQVRRNLQRFTAEWERLHPEAEPGAAVLSRLAAMAWDHERPNKKPSVLTDEHGWRRELADAGYRRGQFPIRPPTRLSLDDLRLQEVAGRALDRCAAASSTWTRHGLQESVTRIVTEAGVQATPVQLRRFIASTTQLAAEGCLSVMPVGAVRLEHIPHLTNLHVVAVETELRDRLQIRATAVTSSKPDIARLSQQHGLDEDQARAAAVVSSDDPLVIVEGAAGSGKTTMLGVAIKAAAEAGRPTRILAPTRKAAEVAQRELGVPADSVAKLLHAHGWRWNRDGVWTRLLPGAADPETGGTYSGPPSAARLVPDERIVVDEAGMLDQDTALALLIVADEAGATLALVGDRAQLAAVGRGGVLEMAAQINGDTVDISSVHRFVDPEYAALTRRMRSGEDAVALFEGLESLGLIEIHQTVEAALSTIATTAEADAAITVATNEEARDLNAIIREERVRRQQVDDIHTVVGNDGLLIGTGDVIQTRKNDSTLHVTNRQTWVVQHIDEHGTVTVRALGGRGSAGVARLPSEYVVAHTHLAYASTAYGVQGTTTDSSHTLLSGGLDASGVYVGMTRGSIANHIHIVAADRRDALEQFSQAQIRDRADRGLADAAKNAASVARGLVEDWSREGRSRW